MQRLSSCKVAKRDLSRKARNKICDEGTSKQIADVLLLIIGIVAIVGLSMWIKLPPPPPEMACGLIVAFDVSLSQSIQERTWEIGILKRLMDSVLPRMLTVYAFSWGGSFSKIYEGTPSFSKDLGSTFELLKNLNTKKEGTSPSGCLQRILDEFKTGAKSDVAVILVWDGEDDAHSQTQKIVRDLSDCENLRAFWIFGIPSRCGNDLNLRNSVDEEFQPLKGKGKLIVTTENDVRWGLDSFKSRIK